jgi:hypothetical protein
VKIEVFSRGKTVIDADHEYQEPQIRKVIENHHRDNDDASDDSVAEAIIEHTDSDRSDISHDQYAIVTEDDGAALWSGWLTGNPDQPPPELWQEAGE